MLGEKNRWGWLVGLVTQLLWLVYIKETQAWGFLLLSAVGIYLNISNFRKWS
jgi:putative Mn2+ efflux pump MntP